jgi:hypothetical protein
MSRDPALSTSLTETPQVPAEGLALWRSSNASCGDCLEECAPLTLCRSSRSSAVSTLLSLTGLLNAD